jgi:hypothetical protein
LLGFTGLNGGGFFIGGPPAAAFFNPDPVLE